MCVCVSVGTGWGCTLLMPPSDDMGRQDWNLRERKFPNLVCYPNSYQKEMQDSPVIPNSIAGLS